MDKRDGGGLTARLNDPRLRGLLYQALLVAALIALVWTAADNAYVNMQARGIPMGFGFWNQVAGFDINLTLIDYSALSTYGRAFWVGLLNTLLVAAIGIPLATPAGLRGRRRKAVAELAAGARWRCSTSPFCATRRCCCNCCSGTTPSSRRCRVRASR